MPAIETLFGVTILQILVGIGLNIAANQVHDDLLPCRLKNLRRTWHNANS